MSPFIESTVFLLQPDRVDLSLIYAEMIVQKEFIMLSEINHVKMM